MFRQGLTVAALAAAIAVSIPTATRACSMCRCGDPTFNALGTDVYSAGNFRIALDWERFDKEQAVSHHHHEDAGELIIETDEHAEEVGREQQVERRVTATLSYAFPRVNVVARIPWSDRTLRAEGEPANSSSDLSDPELYALFRLWSSPFAGDVGRRAWISLLGGVKAPWGENEGTAGGERLEEHLQAGTGSTDWFGGLSGVYLFDARSSLYGSVQVRRMGSNDFGYRYGDVVLANLGYERKLGERFDLAFELNARDAGKDRIDAGGEEDPNTGGALVYATPRLIADFGHGLVGRLAVQIPVADDLNGDQTERAVANFGLTYLVP